MLTPKENALIAYQHKEPEWIPNLMAGDMTMIQACPDMERYTGQTQGKDYWGVEWTFVPDVGAPMPTPGQILFDDISEWRKYVKCPNLDAIDWEKQRDIDIHTDFLTLAVGGGLHPLKDGKTVYDDKDKLRICLILNGPFERLHSFMGFENALAALVEDPDECDTYFETLFNWKIEYIKKIKQYYDVDLINFHDDYGSADRMFMNPDLWRRLIKPHLKRLVDVCHECGYIYQHHSCGHIEPILEDMAEIGVDAIDPLQACNSHLKELKAKIGDRLTFCGGFNNQGLLALSNVTDEEVKQEYRRVVDELAPGGSFVIYSPGASTKAMKPFMEEHFSYGMNFYRDRK